MSVPESENRPMPQPRHNNPCVTESLNSIDAYDDGPGDTTVRPAPPTIPLGSYPRVAQPIQRPTDNPPSVKQE
jgi:hypothetical protein